MRNISILGATGSIGTQTLDVLDKQKEDFNLYAISINKNVKRAIEIINQYNPKYVAVMDTSSRKEITEYCRYIKADTEVLEGMEGMVEIASLEEIDMVVTSVVGMIGLLPTISAIKRGKDIALANKETLVVAGEIVTNLAKENNISILPVDSEHSAIFQCLQGNKKSSVGKIILTASGGPFRGRTRQELSSVTVGEALKHPKWAMGKKISIDSATLMNKGLEVIEARWLFDVDYKDIEVVVHPESVIHSMVEYCDGSIIAQMGTADMRLPIQYALNYPERKHRVVEKLNMLALNSLTFETPDVSNFKCLKLAYEAGRLGKLMPTILNGANEACVELFLNNLLTFNQISDIVEECMMKFDYIKDVTLENIIHLDNEVRNYVRSKYAV